MIFLLPFIILQTLETLEIKGQEYPLVRQPYYEWVSEDPYALTLFQEPIDLGGGIGIGAHDYLAGKVFFDLRYGDILRSGSYEFRVENILRFDRAGDYWTDGSELYSSWEVFEMVYMVPGRLTLQTCTPTGLMFWIAYGGEYDYEDGETGIDEGAGERLWRLLGKGFGTGRRGISPF